MPRMRIKPKGQYEKKNQDLVEKSSHRREFKEPFDSVP